MAAEDPVVTAGPLTIPSTFRKEEGRKTAAVAWIAANTPATPAKSSIPPKVKFKRDSRLVTFCPITHYPEPIAWHPCAMAI